MALPDSGLYRAMHTIIDKDTRVAEIFNEHKGK